MIWQRVSGEPLLLSAAAVSFRTFTEYYSALWSRFAGVWVGGGLVEPYCICNARVWGRDERGSFHILLGWWDLVATQTLQYTLCQKRETRHWVFLLLLFITTLLRTGYAFGFRELVVYALDVLNARASLLLYVVARWLFLLLSKIIFVHDGPSWFLSL
jgi:hypothetical protein